MYKFKAYPELHDEKFFNKLLSKKEIIENKYTKSSNSTKRLSDKSLESHQRFVRTYMGPATPYRSLLLFHQTGTGKTGAAVAIAEANKHFFSKPTLVMAKNVTIADNFRSELSKEMFSNDSYLSQEERNILIAGPSYKQKEVTKLLNKRIKENYEFVNFGMFANRVLGATKKVDNKSTRKKVPEKYLIKDLSDRIIIIDEVHNITRTDTFKALTKVLKNSIGYKIILLTATPAFDRISEFPLIINLLQHPNEPKITNIKDLFDEKPLDFLGKNSNINPAFSIPIINNTGKNTISKFIKGKVSYIKTGTDNFPTVLPQGSNLTSSKGSLIVYKCKMSKHQYEQTIKAIKSDLKDKEKRDVGYKNTSDASTLVYPDNTYGSKGFNNNTKNNTFNKDTEKELKDNLEKYSSKFYHIIQNLKSNKGTSFIYSEYVNKGGLEILTMILELFGYSKYGSLNNKPKYTVLEGKVSEANRIKFLKIFNSPNNIDGSQISILLGSPALSEGITLKNVRQIHIVEPPWNMSTVEQVKGRAIRNYSHEDLPEKDRNVKLYLYTATSPNNEPTIDIVKYLVCQEKDKAIKEVEHIFKLNAVDCALFKERNSLDNDKYKDTRDCEYKSCNYDCSSGTLDDNVSELQDYSTYYQSITPEQLNQAKDKIADLFYKTHVYSLKDITDKIPNISNTLVYIALDQMIKEPETIEDKYGRQGSIIQKGKYYIHQPYSLPLTSTLYTLSKPPMYKQPYNVQDYLDNNKDRLSLATPETPQSITSSKGKDKGKARAKAVTEKTLSPGSKKYNDDIRKQLIYGTPYNNVNVKDNKFRIVNMNNPKNKQKRKVTGQVCTTMLTTELKEIANYLNIQLDKKETRVSLCNKIQKYLQDNNLYLK